jgi:hypothetical protein
MVIIQNFSNFNFWSVFLLPMASLYFIHDHHVLKSKLCFMWLILMKPTFTYIALKFGSQPHMKKLHVSKGEMKKRGWNLHAAGRDSIERKNERRSHFPIVQNPMCGLTHIHTSFAFALPSIPWLFPFLPPFTTSFSSNHDYLPHKLARIFDCFYNIQGVA